MEDIRLEHSVVGSKHVVTSPDVPELHVVHADLEVALGSVQSALDMIARMKARIEAREAVCEVGRERLFA